MGSSRRFRSLNLPHPATLSYLLHRLSGLALILFIPFHLLVAGRVLVESAASTQIADRSSLTLSVATVLGLLTMHIAGGLRIIAIEWLGKGGGQWRWLLVTLIAPFLMMSLVVLIAVARS